MGQGEELGFCGALVGWKVKRYGERLSLSLQCVTKPAPHDPQDITTMVLMLNHQQALQLGQTMFGVTEESQPVPPRRGWLGRMLAP